MSSTELIPFSKSTAAYQDNSICIWLNLIINDYSMVIFYYITLQQYIAIIINM